MAPVPDRRTHGSSAPPRANEAEIEAELAILENADRIGETFITLRNALDADETGILTQLRNSENELSRLGVNFPAAADYATRLHAVVEELKDIDASVTTDSLRIDADPARLQKLTNRLDTLLSLQQKHHVTDEAALITVRDNYAARLATIVHSDEAIADAEKNCKQQKKRRKNWLKNSTKPAQNKHRNSPDGYSKPSYN